MVIESKALPLPTWGTAGDLAFRHPVEHPPTALHGALEPKPWNRFRDLHHARYRWLSPTDMVMADMVVPRRKPLNGRYGAPIPVAPTAPCQRSPVFNREVQPSAVWSDTLWGPAGRWFRVLSQVPFEQILRQLPDLQAAFCSNSDARRVSEPTRAKGRTDVRVLRAAPVLAGPYGAWAGQLADHLQRHPYPAWVRTAGEIHHEDHAPSGLLLSVENLRAIEALAQEVHTRWATICGGWARHRVPALFSRHAWAQAIETTVRPVSPPRPLIVHAPVFRHLAMNQDWNDHPDQGLVVAEALYEMGGTTERTAVVEAVTHNHRALVAWLLDHGASLNTGTANLRPLHLALNHGHVALAQDLLRRGAQHRLITDFVPEAPMLEHLVTLLTDPKANVNALVRGSLRVHQSLVLTALNWAVDKNFPEMVRWLMVRGADPSVKDVWKRTAWDVAESARQRATTAPSGKRAPSAGASAQALCEAFVEHERRALYEDLHGASPSDTMGMKAGNGERTDGNEHNPKNIAITDAAPRGLTTVVPARRPRL